MVEMRSVAMLLEGMQWVAVQTIGTVMRPVGMRREGMRLVGMQPEDVGF